MTVSVSDALSEDGPLWIFGYGSLMWRPGFAFQEEAVAELKGYRRDMCFLSIHYRGTPDAPGLVCGLVPGGTESQGCKGRAFRVHKDHEVDVIEYLDRRELITDIYKPSNSRIFLEDGQSVLARVYLADTAHAQYVGDWSDAEKASVIAAGKGSEGTSLEYLQNIVRHLGELDIHDDHLTRLLSQAQSI